MGTSEEGGMAKGREQGRAAVDFPRISEGEFEIRCILAARISD